MNILTKIVCVSFPLSFGLWVLSCHREESGTKGSEVDFPHLQLPLSIPVDEFRATLERHYPLDHLIKHGVDEKVSARLKDIIAKSTEEATAKTSEVTAANLLGTYLAAVASDNCPQKERDIFCSCVDQLVASLSKDPNNDGVIGSLFLIFSDWWVGWQPNFQGLPADAALEAWHGTEVYQYLRFKVPPKSADVKDRIKMVSRWRSDQVEKARGKSVTH